MELDYISHAEPTLWLYLFLTLELDQGKQHYLGQCQEGYTHLVCKHRMTLQGNIYYFSKCQHLVHFTAITNNFCGLNLLSDHRVIIIKIIRHRNNDPKTMGRPFVRE